LLDSEDQKTIRSLLIIFGKFSERVKYYCKRDCRDGSL